MRVLSASPRPPVDAPCSHSEHALNKVAERLKEGVPVDWQDVVSRFTMDSATEFLFGHDVDSAGAGLPYPPGSPLALADPQRFRDHPSNRFVDAFTEGQNLLALRTRAGATAWRLYEFWRDRVAPKRRVVDKFVRSILDDPAFAARDVEARVGAAGKPGENDTLLHHLLNHTQGERWQLRLSIR